MKGEEVKLISPEKTAPKNLSLIRVKYQLNLFFRTKSYNILTNLNNIFLIHLGLEMDVNGYERYSERKYFLS